MYTLEDVYKTFPAGCTEDYKILRAFEMGKQASDKKIREMEQQIEKMKCCANCKHYFCMCENVDDEKQYCDKWELAE